MYVRPSSFRNLESWLVESFYRQTCVGTGRLSLGPVKEAAKKLSLLKPAPTVFLVGGTNGKGSSCRLLEVMLLAGGFKVGVYTSPHLMRYVERFRVNGVEVAESEIFSSLCNLDKALGALEEGLSFFEYSTLAALKIFQEAGLDAVILEVGLGGRLDATNLVDPDVSVITSVGLDHTRILGHTVEAIGKEKSGIFRRQRWAVVGEPEHQTTLLDEIESQGALGSVLGRDWHYRKNGTVWDWEGQRLGLLKGLPLPQLPLPNAATALAALEASALHLPQEAIREGLYSARLAGRFETLRRDPRVILDVAHNPHAMRYLRGRLREEKDGVGKRHLVFGMLADKSVEESIGILKNWADSIYFGSLPKPRGEKYERLLAYCPAGQGFPSVSEAWEAALTAARPEDTILVTGSFLTVAEVKRCCAEDGQGAVCSR